MNLSYILTNFSNIFFPEFLESNERLQVHLKERMHSLEEKNHLSNELERTKKKLEEAGTNKARLEAELAEMKLNLRLISSLIFSGGYAKRVAENAVRNRKYPQTIVTTRNSFQYSTN